MTKDTFSIRLHEARLMMKLSMDKLAERTGSIITKQSISVSCTPSVMPCEP